MNFHCHRVHLDPAYIGQFWLTYHMNVEFDFETEKWMYSTGEARFQYEHGFIKLLHFGFQSLEAGISNTCKFEIIIRSPNHTGKMAIHAHQTELL